MAILDTAKDAYELAKKGMTIEFQEKIMELREEAITLQEENLALRKHIADLQSRLTTKAQVEFEDGMYFVKRDGGADGPYCARCYDEKEKLIRLQVLPNTTTSATHHCRVCDDYFGSRGRRS